MDLYCRKVVARIKQPDGHYGPPVWVLVGAGPEDCERIAKAPERPLKTSIVAPRDGGRHRWFFKLAQTVYQNLPDGVHMTFDKFREELLISAGHWELYTDWRGNTKRQAKSIAWAKLDETEFNALCDQVVHVICQEIIPGFTTKDAEAAVLEVMG